MTLHIELSPQDEARLQAAAREEGVDVPTFVKKLVTENLPPAIPQGLLPGESLLDGLKRIGVVGAVKGKPRPDGRAWSEVEGFE